MKIFPVRTRIFKENDDLFSFVTKHIRKLKEGSVIAITSKIAALSEGRVALAAGKGQKAEIIRKESDVAVKTKYVWLTMKSGMLLANAGLDESNADGKLILLPKDSFKIAAILRKRLMKCYHISKCGVLITDSRTMPTRAGVVGIALGYAGFKGLRDYRGSPDIFGRKMQITQSNIADSLATAAVLTMGEGKERQPLAVIENAPLQFCEKIDRKELQIDIKDDMYAPIFRDF